MKLKDNNTYWVAEVDRHAIKYEIEQLDKEKKRIRQSGSLLNLEIHNTKNKSKFKNLTFLAFIFTDTDKSKELSNKVDDYISNIYNPITKIKERIEHLKNCYNGSEFYVPKSMDLEQFYNIEDSVVF